MANPHSPHSRVALKDSLYERYRWQVFGITWLAYVGFYLTRKSFSVAKVELAQSDLFVMSTAQMAWIDGALLTCYALGQFVWGMGGDRFGTRRVVLSGMFCSILCAVVAGAASGFVILAATFAVQGLCQSTGWAPLTKNVGNFFSRFERGRVMGAWCTNFAVGGVVASGIAGWAADWYGWRAAFFIPAAVLAGIWMLFYRFQINCPEDVGLPAIEVYHGEAGAPQAAEEKSPTEKPKEELANSWHVIAEVLSNRMVWILCAVYFCLKPTRYLVMFWSPLYISQRLGTGAAASGMLGSMFEVAGPIAMIVGGYISDRHFNSRRVPICVITLTLLGILMFNFHRLPNTPIALGLGFGAVGLLLYIPDSIISGTAALDFGTRRGASTAAGFINGCGSIGAIAGGTMPGWIEQVIGAEGDMWSSVFGGLAIALLASALLLAPRWNAVPKDP